MVLKYPESYDDDFINTFKKMIDIIKDRGTEILSEESFLIWLKENGIKHLEEVETFDDLPQNDSVNTCLLYTSDAGDE